MPTESLGPVGTFVRFAVEADPVVALESDGPVLLLPLRERRVEAEDVLQAVGRVRADSGFLCPRKLFRGQMNRGWHHCRRSNSPSVGLSAPVSERHGVDAWIIYNLRV